MPDSMDIDPAVLRQLAGQHDQVAIDTRNWSEPPYDWLATFQDSYGKIAEPVYQALQRYYSARQEAGNALADEHEHTAAALRAAADAYEAIDHEIGANIGAATDPFHGPGGPHSGPDPVPGDPGATNGHSPSGPGAQPVHAGGPPAGVSTGPLAHDGSPAGPGTEGPGAQPGSGAPNGATPAAAGQPVEPGVVPQQSPLAAGTGGGPLSQGPLTDGGVTAGAGGGSPYPNGLGDNMIAGGGLPPTLSDQSAADAPGTAGTGAAMPAPILLTPFGAAVAAATRQESGPAHVVNEAVNEDLVLARTLLGAVLAAVDAPAIGLSWAVSVMRGPDGPALFITSNEGRGWMPAGLFLPREVSSPWMWDGMLGADGGAPWEGVADPARVLAEFGLAWGPRSSATLSALVSSGPIDASLRARMPDVAMEGLVGPAYNLDLRNPTEDTADRLGLLATAPAAELVAAVPDSATRARGVELAAQAHARLVRSVPAPPECGTVRALRDRVLSMVQAGQQVGRQLWDELREADELLAAAMLSRRVDVGRVDLGALRVDDEASTLRAMVFERRCDELVLLLAQEPTRQGLRDAAYAYAQIMDHPRFVEVPAAIAAPAAVSVAEPAAAAVSAAPPASGPPAGAMVSVPDPMPLGAERFGG